MPQSVPGIPPCSWSRAGGSSSLLLWALLLAMCFQVDRLKERGKEAPLTSSQ